VLTAQQLMLMRLMLLLNLGQAMSSAYPAAAASDHQKTSH
jgi:hypothetical protein